MSKLLKYLKNYIPECIASPVLKLFEVIMELCVPLIVSAVIDNCLKADGAYDFLVKDTLILVGFALGGLIFSITAQYFAAKASTGFVSDIRFDLFRHIEKLEGRYSDKISSSYLLSVITGDIQQLQTGVNLFLRLLLRSPFVVGGAFVMAFMIDRQLSAVFGGVILILSAVVFAILFVSIKMHKKLREDTDEMMKTTAETISGARVIRAFRKEDSLAGKFSEESSRVTKSVIKSNNVSSLMNPLTFLIINGALFLLLYFCGGKVLSGVLSPGQCVALSNYLSQILTELIKLANLIINVSRSIACGNRIQSVFEIPLEEEQEGECVFNEEEDNIIRFDDISLNYTENGEPALSDVSFDVKKGEILAIIGTSGSGKTSIANILSGMYTPTEGNAYFKGINLKDIPKKILRKKIYSTSQKADLFSGTIEDNVLFAADNASPEDAQRALSEAMATGFTEEKGGLSAGVLQHGRNFSGGQRQRLQISGALVEDHDVIVFDDSFSALDFFTESSILKNIRKKNNLTVLMITQRISSLKFADRILVLNDGKVEDQGTFDYLKNNCELFKEIYNSQTMEGN